MQQFAVAGWPVAGCSESNLDRLVRRLRAGWRNFKDILNQSGGPYENHAS